MRGKEGREARETRRTGENIHKEKTSRETCKQEDKIR